MPNCPSGIRTFSQASQTPLSRQAWITWACSCASCKHRQDCTSEGNQLQRTCLDCGFSSGMHGRQRPYLIQARYCAAMGWPLRTTGDAGTTLCVVHKWLYIHTGSNGCIYTKDRMAAYTHRIEWLHIHTGSCGRADTAQAATRPKVGNCCCLHLMLTEGTWLVQMRCTAHVATVPPVCYA